MKIIINFIENHDSNSKSNGGTSDSILKIKYF